MAAILTDALVAKPLPPLTPEQETLVLGGEAALWTEIMTDEMIDARLWPRAAALAERFWSPRTVRDTDDLYRRLPVVQDQLRLQGLRDQADRDRMVARLSPADVPAGGRPARSGGTNPEHGPRPSHPGDAPRGKKIVQDFNALADAAPVDSLVAHRFEARARAYVGRGSWRRPPPCAPTSSPGAPTMSASRPSPRAAPPWRQALPISADIAALAQAGLAALDALEAGKPLPTPIAPRPRPCWPEPRRSTAPQPAPLFSFLGKQPPADLIIKIAPGVRVLVAAAR
jgi:hexosaminidase